MVSRQHHTIVRSVHKRLLQWESRGAGDLEGKYGGLIAGGVLGGDYEANEIIDWS
jgi:hypothetical protein